MKKWTLLFNPFLRIAGGKALACGFAGIVISTVIAYVAGVHYHGLLHYGGAPNSAWWCFAIEHLMVWLVPALLFYIGGLLFSPSRIRLLDVMGTVAFAQIPFAVMNLFYLPKAAQYLLNVPAVVTPEWISSPMVLKSTLLIMPSLIFVVWTMILMFWALKVSCNLKGACLGWTYAIAVIAGDIICRYLIGMMY